MEKVNWAAAAVMGIVCGVNAGETPALPPEKENEARKLEDLYFGKTQLEITPQEKAALAADREWRSDAVAGIAPLRAEDGGVQFVFGMARPSVVCAPLNVTDIELQRGEVVHSLAVGDTAHWKIDAVISGGDTPHIIVKPLDVGITTSMVVATDKRTYHFQLRSARETYMARITFAYRDEITAKFAALEKEAKAKRERDTLPETREYLGNLNFNYRINGNAPWKPIRAYNDGVKTILEMPYAMAQTEAPSLLVLNKEGENIVNYRVQNRRYIVDQIFSEAVLIVGVGKHQEKVTVKYLGREK